MICRGDWGPMSHFFIDIREYSPNPCSYTPHIGNAFRGIIATYLRVSLNGYLDPCDLCKRIFVELPFVAHRSPWLGTDETPIGVQWAGIYNIEIANQEYK